MPRKISRLYQVWEPLRVFSFLLCGGVPTSLLVFAPMPTATILGMVKDSSGAVVPGVTLTTTNAKTGLSRTTNSGGDGCWHSDRLEAGNKFQKSPEGVNRAAMLPQNSPFRFGLTPGEGGYIVYHHTGAPDRKFPRRRRLLMPAASWAKAQ